MAVPFEHRYYREEIAAYVVLRDGAAHTHGGGDACALPPITPFLKCPKVILFRARGAVHLDRQTQTPGVETPVSRPPWLPTGIINSRKHVGPRRFLDEDSRTETAAEGRSMKFLSMNLAFDLSFSEEDQQS